MARATSELYGGAAMADSSTDPKASFAAISNGIVGSAMSTMGVVLTAFEP